MGDSWAALDPQVAALHASSGQARGWMQVRRGSSLLARLLCAVLRMPPARDRVEVRLRVERDERGERWSRTFGEQPLFSTQWADGGYLVEGLGPMQCWFRLGADGSSLLFHQIAATVGLRGFALRLPRLFWPLVEGRADAAGSAVHVDVRIHAPLVGLLVAYEGTVTPGSP
jgi:hypothetical protein